MIGMDGWRVGLTDLSPFDVDHEYSLEMTDIDGDGHISCNLKGSLRVRNGGNDG